MRIRIGQNALLLCLLLVAAGCGGATGTATPVGPVATLGAPGIEGPSHDAQVQGTRPVLVIRNAGASTLSGPRSYEVQVAREVEFSTVVFSATVPEGSGANTVVTVDRDLPADVALHWRARLLQGGETSDWSLTATFRTSKGGFNRAGELWDPLTDGVTVGTTNGPVTFIPGRGIRLESESAYVRYQLPQTVSAGEFSMLVEGIRANGPNHKLKIFSMADTAGNFIGSRFEAAAHYRGIPGNPDNAISLKVVWGTPGVILEPDFGTRAASVVALDAGTVYFWQGTWNSNSFRLVVRAGGTTGGVIYDRTFTAPASAGSYSPSPHYAYLGANSGQFGSDAGTWPGMIVRDVWLGTRARPAVAGSAR